MAKGIIGAGIISAFLWASHASAAVYRAEQSGGGTLLRIEGEIQKGDLEKLEQHFVGSKIKPQTIHTIVFNSPGGQVHEALRIGRFIREQKVGTRVNIECASACVYAFLGGVVREIGPGGRFGVHMHSGQNSDKYISLLKEILQKREYDLDTRIRYIVMLNESISAQISGEIATYIISMGVSIRLLETTFKTQHYKMHWLTEFELKDFNVINAR